MRKCTVDESYRLRLYQLLPLELGRMDLIGCGTDSVWAQVQLQDDRPVLEIQFYCGQEKQKQTVPLVGTKTGFGRRPWLICPLIRNGSPCGRRVDTLMRPKQRRFYGCRKCHDLRYRSSQKAHEADRIAAKLGFPPEDVKLLLGQLWLRDHDRRDYLSALADAEAW